MMSHLMGYLPHAKLSEVHDHSEVSHGYLSSINIKSQGSTVVCLANNIEIFINTSHMLL